MRRIVFAVLALAVLLPSLAQARARWMTDVDLYVRDECCCPPKKAERPPMQPTLQKVCCKLEKRSATALPLGVETQAPATAALEATSFAFVPVMPPQREVAVAIVPRAQAPPETLLAQHRGLLL